MENGFSRASRLIAGVSFLIFTVTSILVVGSGQANDGDGLPPHRPGEVVVKLKESISTFSLQSLGSVLSQGRILNVKRLNTDAPIAKLKLSADADLNQAIQELKAHPSVQYAEPNYLYQIVGFESLEETIPNDTDFAKLWGMRNTGQTDAGNQVGTAGADIDITRVWAEGFTGSKDIVVAVIDTGIDWTHPDLVDNLYTNPGEAGALAENGVDDDGNGFIDDTHGFNFAADNRNSSDDHSHGTHCSGTIGGVGNNGVGVAGVNWNVTLMPVKFLTASGSGTLEDAVESINYATKMKVDVMSNSWGGGGYSQLLEDAIKAARDAGIIFVAAAGNSSQDNDLTPSYPASYPIENVISVAATDNKDTLAYFSSYGKTSVHVAAPGVKIYSSVMGGKYDHFSGTSMATPHVAGIAALMLSVDSTLDYAEVKRRLIDGSDWVPGLRRKVVAKGRVNAYNAIHNISPEKPEPDESLWKDVPYSLESKHPYDDGTNETYTIEHAGAKYIRVVFAQLDIEKGYDKLNVQDGAGNTVEALTGAYPENYVSEYVEGSKLILNLTADSIVNKYGFKISRIQIQE